ncbi:unnamed protein product [Lactuca saligna]|nr:unnamed protein product [Lactuca saligna]
MIGMGDDMYVVASEVDYCMLERYSHEYHLSHVLGFQLLSSSLSVLDAPPGKKIPLDVSLLRYLYRLAKYDRSKCFFRLTSYLAGYILPESIVVDEVVPDQYVDEMTVTLESPLALPGPRCVSPLSFGHVAPKQVGM